MASPSDAAASVDSSAAAEAADGRALSARLEAGEALSQLPQPAEGSSPGAGSPATAEPAQAEPATAEPAPTDGSSFHIGQAVRLRHVLPYLRSAEPMPMLRPPDLVDHQEVGEVRELRSLGRVTVRFRRGQFLIDAADLEAISDR